MNSARTAAALCGIFALGPIPAAHGQTATFADVSQASGIVENDFGYAAAWGDYDGDQDLDLVVTNAYGPPRLWIQQAGSFTDGAAAAGLSVVIGSDGVAWGDYDNDGDLDLYFARRDDAALPDMLMRNDGSGVFTDVAPSLGLADGNANRTVSWVDYDRDGDLDLFVTPCDDPGGGTAALYAWDGATYQDVSVATGIANLVEVRGPAFLDYDGDADLDLAVGSPTGPVLVRNDGGTFVDVTAAAGLGGFAVWPYTASSADYDNDGDFDLFFPTEDLGDRGLLFRNDGGTFTEVGSASGLLAATNQHDAKWADYDHDGDMDLFVTGLRDGNWVGLRDLLYRNLGNGLFVEVAQVSGIQDGLAGVGAAWGDYDADGDLDLFVVNADYGQDRLYRNDGSGIGNWVDVRTLTDLEGDATNPGPIRDAIGALIEVDLDGGADFAKGPGAYVACRVDGGSGWGQGAGTQRLGVGSASAVDLRVTFPDGSGRVICDASTNVLHTVLDPGPAPPTVASVTPSILPFDGGAGDLSFVTVTIVGSSFTTPMVTDVRVGGVSALSFIVDHDCQITAVFPPAPCTAGSCQCVLDVEVENGDGVGTLVNGVTYTEAPLLIGTTPKGMLFCGPSPMQVVVQGKNFQVDPTSTLAKINGVSLVNQVIVSDNLIMGQVPALPKTGVWAVTVGNACGKDRLEDGFTTYPHLDTDDAAQIGATILLDLKGRPGDLYLAYFSFGNNPSGTVLPPLCGSLLLRASYLYTIAGGIFLTDEVPIPFGIPNNPLLVGTPVYFQALEAQTAPSFAGAWSPLVSRVVLP